MTVRGRANVGILAMMRVALMCATLAFVSPAAAQDASARGVFSQPDMPLAEALRKFAQASGFDVVFQEDLVKGRRAAPVRDARTAHAALAQMLAGSGLAPRFTRANAFILEKASAAAPAELTLARIEVVTQPLGQREAAYRWYGEKLLQASLATLRQSRELGMRSYDFTIYVWLSEAGTIVNLEGHGAADQNEMLATASKMLKGVVVGIVPPANMPQPVGLRIKAQ